MSLLNFITWNVSPEIFHIGSVHIRYYGLLFALGFMISVYIVQKIYKDASFPIEEVDKLTIYTVIGAVVGARFCHVFIYEFDYYKLNPQEILKVWHGGLASHGGVIGILISTYLYSRKYKREYLWLLDTIAIPAALTGALVRIGNFMNSEIYGVSTHLPWGVVFVQNGETVPKHPTQIYEAIAYLLTFILLVIVYKKTRAKNYKGRILGVFFVCVFSFRFFIEFIKNNQVDSESSMFLNYGQLLSIPLVILGFILIYNSSKVKASVNKP